MSYLNGFDYSYEIRNGKVKVKYRDGIHVNGCFKYTSG